MARLAFVLSAECLNFITLWSKAWIWTEYSLSLASAAGVSKEIVEPELEYDAGNILEGGGENHGRHSLAFYRDCRTVDLKSTTMKPTRLVI